ncbi:TM1812 family CRISPR-associated protein [Campylobacter sp. JMF_01 NE2]|uniref:TM1812 family CRISPR-associated protein n=1 Tax=unclassified Campylobacter TaxID=2593542 RepID=UPI0022E9AFF5|nr:MULTISPECIES: TM1812 family CRISPR-associated protein [unclassified Campylobacter]MDA3052860.1 TM1812 family CRISPR-associated protein [Campylobacter sp. JMF_03 NE3]MDA3067191.1 TM1812 family CRISPR-associated protein [Campylobacter sp. JMF_01 NE2]
MSETKKDKKAVITILGIAGGDDKAKKASYYLENMELNTHFEYFNTFPFLCDTFGHNYNYDIVAVFTQSAKQNNHKVIEKTDFKKENSRQIALNSLQNGCEIDDTDYDKIFQKINEILNDEKYGEFIIDITHGFRHLPILTMVAMMIANFKDTKKIKHIFFAKEIKAKEKYEIIDLKIYLDIANISFILTAFSDNYTISNHIKSAKFEKLLKALNSFSNDIMALNISNLQNSQEKLVSELDKIDNEAVKDQAQNLKTKIQNLADFVNDKRSEILYKLALDLFDKNYLFLSLASLFESTRSFMVELINDNNPGAIEKVRNFHKNQIKKKREKNPYFTGDLGYRVDDFCVRVFKFKLDKIATEDKYEAFLKFINTKNNNEKIELNNDEIDALIQTPLKVEKIDKIAEFYADLDVKRNDLAHANSSGKAFDDIKNEVKDFLEKYENLVSCQNK